MEIVVSTKAPKGPRGETFSRRQAANRRKKVSPLGPSASVETTETEWLDLLLMFLSPARGRDDMGGERPAL
jgi:hypothetical protein